MTQESKEKYIKLMKEFYDVFSQTYDDLKVYDPGVIHHTIPVQKNAKPFKQKLRRINPLLLPLIEKEAKKLFDAKIIVYLRFSKWLVLTGVTIPPKKGRHFPFHKSQLDSRMFGMVGSTGLWTCYHSKFVVWCDLKIKNNKISQLSEYKIFYQTNLI